MNAPQTLSRPLAARVAGLPEPRYMPTQVDLPEAVIEASVKAMRDGQTHYTDRPGIGKLRSKVVDALGKHYGLEMGADEVTITCGGTEARFVAFKQLVKDGEAILSAGDSAHLQPAAQLIGHPIFSPSDSHEHVALLYLTPADPPEIVQPLLQEAAERNWWVLWDTSRGFGATTFHPAQQPGLAKRVVSIGSFTGEMPGWRVGWMGGSQAANKLRAFKQSMTICSMSISQWAALGLGDES